MVDKIIVLSVLFIGVAAAALYAKRREERIEATLDRLREISTKVSNSTTDTLLDYRIETKQIIKDNMGEDSIVQEAFGLLLKIDRKLTKS